MIWRAVKSLLTLQAEVNQAYPGRSKASDGLVGDLAHQAESTSDHNPHIYPALGSTAVVCALDITHDPAHGCDTYDMAEAMRQARDQRVGYIISNRRITGPNHGWNWDPYTGSDPHQNHMHVSSVHTAVADDETPWHFNPQGDAMLADDIRTTWGQGLGQYLSAVEHAVWDPALANSSAAITQLTAIQASLAAIAAKVGVPVTATVDVAALAASLKAAGIGQVDVNTLATALAPHLPSHITLTGTVA